jgi:hypothetical protein
MALSREQLIDLAISRYFGGHNLHDEAHVLKAIAKNCVVRFNASHHQFSGYEAIKLHTRDFMESFAVIKFHSFENVVDVDVQAIASRFTVELTDVSGAVTVMKNCNFFRVNKDGLFDDILIFNSASLDKGFRDGNTG